MNNGIATKAFSDEQGFTLLEMLIVIGILAAVTASAVTALRPPSAEVMLTQITTRLAAGLRASRSLAINSGTEQSFSIDLAKRLYWQGKSDRNSRKRPLPNGAIVHVVTATGTATELGIAEFIFFPDGSATGGTMEIELGSGRKTITVDWLSGAVRLGTSNE